MRRKATVAKRCSKPKSETSEGQSKQSLHMPGYEKEEGGYKKEGTKMWWRYLKFTMLYHAHVNHMVGGQAQESGVWVLQGCRQLDCKKFTSNLAQTSSVWHQNFWSALWALLLWSYSEGQPFISWGKEESKGGASLGSGVLGGPLGASIYVLRPSWAIGGPQMQSVS